MSFIICSMPGCQTSAGCQCDKPKLAGWSAGKQIITGAKEALAVAKGEQPAASITVNGHTYYPASEITRLQAELSKMTAWRKEEFERAERMADDWAEFCKALDLEWGDQQHAVNQIVANFNKASKEARAEALEEAAKVADEARIQHERAYFKNAVWLDAQLAQHAMDIAAAIRRLKEGA